MANSDLVQQAAGLLHRAPSLLRGASAPPGEPGAPPARTSPRAGPGCVRA